MRANTFVRFPSDLMEALLGARLSGTSWRIVLWVVRQTYGWNRTGTRFSWYRIARELAMDRGGVVRSGNRLLRARVLCLRQGSLGVQEDCSLWDSRIFRSSDDNRQLWMPGISADGHQRKAVTNSIATADRQHRDRCQASSLFRRLKDSSKDKLKTYKNEEGYEAAREVRHRRTAHPESSFRQPLAGSAEPISDKYDGISEN